MDVAHVGLVHYDSCRCEYIDVHAICFYERQVKRNTCKGCNILACNKAFIMNFLEFAKFTKIAILHVCKMQKLVR